MYKVTYVSSGSATMPENVIDNIETYDEAYEIAENKSKDFNTVSLFEYEMRPVYKKYWAYGKEYCSVGEALRDMITNEKYEKYSY